MRKALTKEQATEIIRQYTDKTINWRGHDLPKNHLYANRKYNGLTFAEHQYIVDAFIHPTMVPTEYGDVAVIHEDGVNKVDYDNSEFHSNTAFLAFLKDAELQNKLLTLSV
jgi:hypothetical protein